MVGKNLIKDNMASKSRLDVGEVEKTLEGLIEDSEVYKMEALWCLSFSSTSTGINSHREYFKKNFLDHLSKYLEIKHDGDGKNYVKEINDFLFSLSKKANLLSEKRYDPVSEVRKELKKIREILEDNEESRNILIDFIDGNYPSFDSVKKKIIKYLAVSEKENISEIYVKSVLEKKFDDEHDFSNCFEELMELKFESGLFLSKTYIKGSSQDQRKDHKAQSVDFLLEYFLDEYVGEDELSKIEESLASEREKQREKEEKAKQEEEEKDVGWGGGEILEESENREERKEKTISFVENLIESEDYPSLDVLYVLAYNESPKSETAERKDGTWKDIFEEWLRKISEYNIRKKYGEEEVERAVGVIEELKEGIPDFMFYDEGSESRYVIDRGNLREALESYTSQLFLDASQLNEKEKVAVSFFKRLFQDTGERTLPVESEQGGIFGYYETDLNKIAGILSNKTEFEFDRKTHVFTETKESRGFRGLTYEPLEYPCSELGDIILKMGGGLYNFRITGSDNLKIGFTVFPSVVKNCDVEAMEESIESLEKSEEKIELDDVSPPRRFEKLITEIVAKEGYSSRNIGGSGEQGADVLAEGRGDRIAIQVKHTKSGSVGPRAVREASSGRDNYGANKAIAVCNKRFSSQAKSEAKKQNVILWEGNDIHRKINEYNINLKKYL